MPKAFESCIAKGGRVRTKKLENGKYIHLCFIDGKSYSGEVKKSKKAKKTKKTPSKQSSIAKKMGVKM